MCIWLFANTWINRLLFCRVSGQFETIKSESISTTHYTQCDPEPEAWQTWACISTCGLIHLQRWQKLVAPTGCHGRCSGSRLGEKIRPLVLKSLRFGRFICRASWRRAIKTCTNQRRVEPPALDLSLPLQGSGQNSDVGLSFHIVD